MNFKTLKDRIKEWLKSDFTKSLEKVEQKEKELADQAMKIAEQAGIKSLEGNLMLFYPNKYYHKDLGVVSLTFGELHTLATYLLREGKFNNNAK